MPEILYMGGEFCPYCAAERWSIIVALSRFGTFSGLGNMSSYANDVYPNTPTFTFLKANYTSKYLVFKHVELYANYLNKAKTYYATLQKPTKQEEHEIDTYDTEKYITGLTPSTATSIPFLSYANKFLSSGASYSPSTLAGSIARGHRGGTVQSDQPDYSGDHRVGQLQDRHDLLANQSAAEQRLFECGRDDRGQGNGH